MPEKVLELDSAVVESAYLYTYELKWAKTRGTTWYRSKEKKSGTNPFNSYMMNKKWTLEEEFNNHLLRFQQVAVNCIFIKVRYNLTFQAGLTATEVGFNEENPDDKPEPLEMEHFYFPLGLWLAGLVISLIFLLAEIILNRRKKSKREVPMLTPEESRVTQSQLEIECNTDADDIENTEV